MKNRGTIRVLACEQDRERLAPVLTALRAMGFRTKDLQNMPGKNDTVLAVLTEAFFLDPDKRKTVLDSVAAGVKTVIPFQLDGTPVPRDLKDVLYARNIISSEGRTAEQAAERIRAAVPGSGMPKWLPFAVAGAGALAVILAVILIRRPDVPREDPSAGTEVSERQEIPVPAGITEQDLAQITSLTIVGDLLLYGTAGGERVDLYTNTYGSWEEDGAHWYSKDDGHEYRMTAYDDLRFISLMPNLRTLDMALVDAGDFALPDMTGLLKGGDVRITDCRIQSLGWLSGSGITSIQYNRSGVTDFSPLTECAALKEAGIDLYGQTEADLSGFAPPSLEQLRISNGHGLRSIDLSAVSGLKKLREMEISLLPLSSLSLMEGLESLQRLRIEYMDALRDISAVGSLKKLDNLYIGYSANISDYSPIAGCTALQRIHVQGDFNPDGLRDASFLSDLPELFDIGLYSCNLRDMEFLKGIAEHQDRILLGFAGHIRDYSGLAYMHRYEYLHINPRGGGAARGGEFSAVLPYIRDAEIDRLMLYTCRGVDLSELPDGIRILSIRYGDLENLQGLKPYSLDVLELYDCRHLSSLDGIENIQTLPQEGRLELDITGCPRLTDYTALDGANLETLKLQGVYTLPDLTRFRMHNLFLESIEDLSDLHILDGVNGGDGLNLYLTGLDSLYDLTPLRNLHGEHLTVPPQVAEQAEELVENGNYRDYEVAYPDASWQPFEGEMALLSMEELATLPKALLKRITSVCAAGGQIVDPEEYDIVTDWEHRNKDGSPQLLLQVRGTEEQIPAGDGIVTDLSAFSGLTGLRLLILQGQPIGSLDGIQSFPELQHLTAAQCPKLSDASAAFSVQSLREINLNESGISSIQGIRNLTGLTSLSVSNTNVTDLSPLSDCDLSAAYEQGGFHLDANGLDLGEEDFAALGSVRTYEHLSISNQDPAVWMPALRDSDLFSFYAHGCLRTNEDLAAFAADHPEIRRLWIGDAEKITDLSCLIDLPDLEMVSAGGEMQEAIASLDGKDIRFELRIEG